MKATLPLIGIIIATALVTGWWQRRELARLESREAELAAKYGVHRSSGEASASGAARRDARPSLDAAGFVGLIARSARDGSRPGARDRASLRDHISTASGRELREWAVALRDSDVPEDLKKDVLASLAPRLAESDPRLAAELVLAGDDGLAFRSVMRTWLAADAPAAAAWLAGIKAPEFAQPGGFDFPVLALAAQVAADPGNPAVLLEADGAMSRSSLEELSSILAPPDFSATLHRFSTASDLPENVRMHVMGIALANHRDPAEARQMLLDATLDPNHLARVTAAMMREQDPASRAATIEWVRGLPEFPLKVDLLTLGSSLQE
ncbi:hypothetical protein OKA04_09735 [Luteolibacter flavescens]|uniref:HEAT repeat domain-containing protein n=1 Tax=Luteolibacter flavescens TaxID=1859460 RepID=A0ABT3FNG7_9BACT|nr:hypothetical protein [Luteolibacter flavescens]MCW1885007.1 hypothetical protein [Luteolibacter flavescens]